MIRAGPSRRRDVYATSIPGISSWAIFASSLREETCACGWRLSGDESASRAFDDAFGAGVGAEVKGVDIADGPEFPSGGRAAHAGFAVKQDGLGFVFHARRERGFDPVEGKIDGIGQVARIEFGGGTDVDDEGAVAQIFMSIFGRDLTGAP